MIAGDVFVREQPRNLFRSDPEGDEYDRGDLEIFVMNADATVFVRLTENSAYDSPTVWSP